MSLSPFSIRAADPAPAPAELLLSMAAEFHPVHQGIVDRRLEQLADRLRRARARAHWRTAATEREILAATSDLTTARDDAPEAFMLDAVLARGKGHPLVIAVVAQEVGRRAGLPLAVLGNRDTCVVGDIRFEPAVLVDPARRASWPFADSSPKAIKPQCPHEIAFAVLMGLTAAYALRGDVGRAIQATDLRLALSMSERVRRTVELERHSLEALLN